MAAFGLDILGLAVAVKTIREGEKKIGAINLVLFLVATLASAGMAVLAVLILLAKLGRLAGAFG